MKRFYSALIIIGLILAVGVFPAFAAGEKGIVTIKKGEPVHIAYWFVISGPNTSLGMDTVRGCEIAIEDFGGKIKGHPIKLSGQDSACNPEGGQAAATKIASDDSIVAVVGHNCSSSCTPAAPIYNDAGMTMISPSCTAPALTDPASHVPSMLRSCHNDNVQGRVMAEYVFNELGLSKAATNYFLAIFVL